MLKANNYIERIPNKINFCLFRDWDLGFEHTLEFLINEITNILANIMFLLLDVHFPSLYI